MDKKLPHLGTDTLSFSVHIGFYIASDNPLFYFVLQINLIASPLFPIKSASEPVEPTSKEESDPDDNLKQGQSTHSGH